MWEVGWRLNRLQHIDPQVPLSLAALLSHSAGLLRDQALWFSLPGTATRTSTATESNSLELSVAPDYIIFSRSPAPCGRRFCTEFNPSTGQGLYLDVFDRIQTVPWLTAGAEGQYVTQCPFFCPCRRPLPFISLPNMKDILSSHQSTYLLP